MPSLFPCCLVPALTAYGRTAQNEPAALLGAVSQSSGKIPTGRRLVATGVAGRLAPPPPRKGAVGLFALRVHARAIAHSPRPNDRRYRTRQKKRILRPTPRGDWGRSGKEGAGLVSQDLGAPAAGVAHSPPPTGPPPPGMEFPRGGTPHTSAVHARAPLEYSWSNMRRTGRRGRRRAKNRKMKPVLKNTTPP